MTDQHPITPPPELVEQWECEYHHSTLGPDFAFFISERAARWGADQELEACCNWLPKLPPWSGENLRKHRRPKPLSLKKQALALLDKAEDPRWDIEDFSIIRRALEALPND